MSTLEQATKEFHGDAQHTYLTGFSMGGFGAWHLAEKYPGRFAALVVICGGIRPPAAARKTYPDLAKLTPADLPQSYSEAAERVGKTPVWIFHGADDDIVPVTESRRMNEAMKRFMWWPDNKANPRNRSLPPGHFHLLDVSRLILVLGSLPQITKLLWCVRAHNSRIRELEFESTGSSHKVEECGLIQGLNRQQIEVQGEAAEVTRKGTRKWPCFHSSQRRAHTIHVCPLPEVTD